MKRLCLAVTCAVMLSMSGCMEYSERTHSPIVYETTTVPDASQSVSTQEVQNYIMQISSTTSELSYAEEGKTDKHLACVLRVKDDSATTLLVNLYDELGRITGTTKGDVTVDYEYDKESRVTKESKYYKGLYQGCCVHEYFQTSTRKPHMRLTVKYYTTVKRMTSISTLKVSLQEKPSMLMKKQSIQVLQ